MFHTKAPNINTPSTPPIAIPAISPPVRSRKGKKRDETVSFYTSLLQELSHQEVNFSCSRQLIKGFTLSGFLRKETLGIISHNYNIMSKTRQLGQCNAE